MNAFTRASVTVVPTDAQLLEGVRLALRMWEESPTYQHMPKDANKVIEFAYNMRAQSDTLVLVAVDDEDAVCGFMIGSVCGYGFSNQRFAYDQMVFAAPEIRGGMVAKALIAAFETWAFDKGASRIMLGISTGVHTERTEKLYNALGYATVGVLTMKEIH